MGLILTRVFGLANKSVISIIGAGGKTCLMFLLAKELSKSKVLVTTTTKVYVPQRKQYDYIDPDQSKLETYKKSSNKGIYVLGKEINHEGKLVGLDCESLNAMKDHFDYILIEADGSKGKPIKGWNDFEPLVCDSTDKTIGVVDITAVGKRATAENVLRLSEFTKLCSIARGEVIGLKHLARMIAHPDGLFKKAIGDRILYLNKVETKASKRNCQLLIKQLLKANSNVDRIVSGSVKNRDFALEYER